MPESSPTTIWYVYILRCADNSLYTGISKNVIRRLQEHNHDNRLAAKYTRSRRPVSLIYQECCDSRSTALKREYALKKLNRAQKEALVIQKFHHALTTLSIKPTAKLNKTLEAFYLPLARWCIEQKQKTCLIIGINGSQGSGKSTLSHILKDLLEQTFNQRVLNISIDDFYKSHQQRQKIANDIHPLLSTRGVPGTHHIQQIIALFNALKKNDKKGLIIPCFNKATDNPYPKKTWRKINQPIDIILFEGWCVGASAEEDKNLANPINYLEREQDNDGQWREYVNQQLKNDYKKLFSYIDKLIYLQIPSFEHAQQWRLLQEHKLAKSTNTPSTTIMTNDEIHHFMMHYERITRHCMKVLPNTADIIVNVDDEHLMKIKE